ncbi:hypothetical protein [Paenibacillus sp. FJAT-26967]|uniref:hypothetical protein n=1 Tax=Paenibacillus sp. FJAT-26967 TaxID=1729690 RepID=UPI000B2CFAA5|nr:hypothetical protein [Paenibacillus sp. FJAT-26967]
MTTYLESRANTGEEPEFLIKLTLKDAMVLSGARFPFDPAAVPEARAKIRRQLEAVLFN